MGDLPLSGHTEHLQGRAVSGHVYHSFFVRRIYCDIIGAFQDRMAISLVDVLHQLAQFAPRQRD